MAIGAALAALISTARSTAAADIDVTDLVAHPHFQHSIVSMAKTGRGVEVRYTAADAFFVISLDRELPQGRLRLDVASLGALSSAELYYGHRGEAPRPGLHAFGVIDPLEHRIDFPLLAGDYGELRIDLDPDTQVAEIVIQRASLVGPDPLDSPLLQHVLIWVFAGAIALAWLVPGLLLQVIFFPGRDPETFELACFPLGIAFHFLFYALLGILAERTTGAAAPPRLWAWAWAASLLFASAAALSGPRRARMRAVVRRERAPLLCFAALLFVSTLLLGLDERLPLTHFGFGNVAGVKTFTTYESGDNFFQYANGRAIALHEPFSRYYGDGKLTYDVTAREILPGVLYSVMRQILAAGSGVLSDSFFLYTLFGTVLNLMVIFPLAHLARRYGYGGLFPALCLTLAANAFFLANSYYAWFKFAGAALVLSGFALLLEEGHSISSWLWAGALFGLGGNMHAGNLLALPPFLAWMTWRRLRAAPARLRALLAPIALCLVTAACMFPWNLVKLKYLHRDDALFEELFLNGEHDPRGLLASLRDFLHSVPLREQLVFRASRILAALRLPEIASWVAALGSSSLSGAALRWSRLELRYSAPLLYPCLAFFALEKGLFRGVAGTAAPQNQREQRALLWLGGLTLFGVVAGAYGQHPPDLTAVEPNAILLLVFLLLAGRVLAGSPPVAAAYLVFSLLQGMRVLAVLIHMS